MFNQSYDGYDEDVGAEDNYSIKLAGLIYTVKEKVNPGAKK